jgi:nitrate reductase NapD
MSEGRQLSRRAFLTAAAPARYHVSSAVVVALPAHRQEVSDRVMQLPGVEVHASEGTRIVITIEGQTSGMLGETLSRISLIEGVISANMVFEHIEEDVGS